MPRALNITGEYPPDWPQISDATWAVAGHRCIRCLHPYKKGEHAKGEWSPCDDRCRHTGPLGCFIAGNVSSIIAIENEQPAGGLVQRGRRVFAQWRIGTVHHLDGNKSNCEWWNLLALCQRCHLTIQSRVNPQQPYMLEHSDWFKLYVCGFYAFKYQGRQITRDQALAEMDQLLQLERIA